MGVSRYLSCLLRALAELAPQHEYLLYLCRSALDAPPFKDKPFSQRVIGRRAIAASPLVWQQCVLPWSVYRDQIDILFSPYYCGPLWSSVPQVVGLHDISFALFPDDFPSCIRFKPKLLARPSSWRAARVTTVSEFSRQEILRAYRLPPDKVVVISPGAGQRGWERERVHADVQKIVLQCPFFLFVGSLLPRRQIKSVIQALGQLPARYHLVVAGESDPNRQHALREMARNWKIADRVHLLGHVSDADLETLYQHTRALVSPSTYEGFGLPVLEALTRGVPVIAWDIPVMREVVGTAGRLIKIGDLDALAQAMLQLAADTPQREALRQAGKEQAQKYSWRRSAQLFLAVLHDVVRQSKRCARAAEAGVSR